MKDAYDELRYAVGNRGEVSEAEAFLMDADVRLFFKNDNAKMLRFFIDIGRYLSFERMPRSESWGYAGRSFLFGEFCRLLWARIHIPNHGSPTLLKQQAARNAEYSQDGQQEDDDDGVDYGMLYC